LIAGSAYAENCGTHIETARKCMSDSVPIVFKDQQVVISLANRVKAINDIDTCFKR
jgi:hypothetical protein